jgi:hypothetical protein
VDRGASGCPDDHSNCQDHASRPHALDESSRSILRVCVSWVSGLETVAVDRDGVIQDIADGVLSAPDVPTGHKLFIYRGFLLDHQLTVSKAKLHEGCVVHMVLSEAPFLGRRLQVRRVEDETMLAPLCSPDFSISEVKHELACFPGARPRSQMRLAFAGRELEDGHTLREYNIQKDHNCLILLAEPKSGRHLRVFVSALAPQRDAIGVACDTRIGIHFTRVIQDESHFWGQMLGRYRPSRNPTPPPGQPLTHATSNPDQPRHPHAFPQRLPSVAQNKHRHRGPPGGRSRVRRRCAHRLLPAL